jgi:hypothetical protein
MSSQKEKRWRRFCGNDSFRPRLHLSIPGATGDRRFPVQVRSQKMFVLFESPLRFLFSRHASPRDEKLRRQSPDFGLCAGWSPGFGGQRGAYRFQISNSCSVASFNGAFLQFGEFRERYDRRRRGNSRVFVTAFDRRRFLDQMPRGLGSPLRFDFEIDQVCVSCLTMFVKQPSADDT